MNALQICGISVICVGKNSGNVLTLISLISQIFFRYYYVVHECTMLCGRKFLFMAVWDDGCKPLLKR